MKRDVEMVIFRTEEPKDLARAVSMLRAANCPFRVLENTSRGARIPRRAYAIVVPPESAARAKATIAAVPSSVLAWAASSDPEDRLMARYSLALLVVVLGVALVMAVLNS